MRPRATEVQAVDRRSVVTPSRNGAHEQDLIEGQLALRQRPLRDPETLLDVHGRQHVAMENGIGESGNDAGDPRRDLLHERARAVLVPRAVLEMVWRVLHARDDDVLAPSRRRELRPPNRWSEELHVRLLGDFAVLRRVGGLLEGDRRRREADGSGKGL